MSVNLRKFKTLQYINKQGSFIVLQMLPSSQIDFISFKNKLNKNNLRIKVAKTKEVKAFLQKIYNQDVYHMSFELQFHGQMYIIRTIKSEDCLFHNYYMFYTNEIRGNAQAEKKMIVWAFFYKSFFYNIKTLDDLLKKTKLENPALPLISLVKTSLSFNLLKFVYYKLIFLLKNSAI
jgi:hypothetical protein